MAVTLTDEEFLFLYQGVHLSIHPGQDFVTALLAGYTAMDVLDGIPETSALRREALETLPGLRERMRQRQKEHPVDLPDMADLFVQSPSPEGSQT
jgi:hypothetical protein